MSGSAQPGALPPGGYSSPGRGPGAWGPPPGGGGGWGPPRGPGGWGGRPWDDRPWEGGGWSPWQMVWAMPKPVLITMMVLGFIAFWPIGLAILAFLMGTGRIGPRWWQRTDADGNPVRGGCGSRRAARRREREMAGSSGNAAFDEYREETLRRLEEEQREFAGFLERLRVAKDKAEFDQFMAERRQRPPAPPAEG